MKKLLIILAVVFFVPLFPAVAAMEVPGDLPNVQPLFPLPTRTHPDYSGNLNATTTQNSVNPEESAVIASGTGPSGQGQGSAGFRASANPNYSFGATFFESTAGKSLLWIFPALAVLGFLFWLTKRRNGKK